MATLTLKKPKEKAKIELNHKERKSKDAVKILKALKLKYKVLRELKPLKIGIHQDFIELEKDNYKPYMIRHAIHLHVNSWQYCQSMKMHTHRYDLDGARGEEITDDHKKLNVEKIKQIKRKFKKRND